MCGRIPARPRRTGLPPGPAARFAQPSLIDPDTCPQRGDWPDPWVEVGDIQALGVVEQGERAGRISLHARVRAMATHHRYGFWRDPRCVAHLLADHQVLHGRIEVIAFEEAFAHAHVHVRRPAQRDRTLLGREAQASLVRVHGFPETTLLDPMSARAMAHPTASARCPADSRFVMASVQESCAASRSPLSNARGPGVPLRTHDPGGRR